MIHIVETLCCVITGLQLLSKCCDEYMSCLIHQSTPLHSKVTSTCECQRWLAMLPVCLNECQPAKSMPCTGTIIFIRGIHYVDNDIGQILLYETFLHFHLSKRAANKVNKRWSATVMTCQMQLCRLWKWWNLTF